MSKAPVILCDVAPRDGFQVVPTWIPTETKVRVIEGLAAAGMTRIEAGAFVSPKHVPQMADTAEVHAKVRVPEGTSLTALTPNLRGAQNAFDAGCPDIGCVFSASESHNKSNVRRPVAASIEELGLVIEAGKDVPGFKLRVNVATSFDCPFEGRVPEDDVYACIDKVLAYGHEVEIGLCDTTGRALPDHVAELCAGAIERFSGGVANWAYHGHDTFGLGVANALYAYDAGVRVFDASVAGLGGCPFAPGATGNTASEDLVFTFENMGIATGVDLAKLLDVAEEVAALPDTDTGGHIRVVPRKRVLAAA
ncbi:MAG: hydroxymethylglutaryl-CoA lyase [Rhodospirillales bacterium]|nr:hydroxymethylglutaryl-CoA lyase [Rhodospirillales bacterium]MBO6785303.1 hydroxymethylglutaryl-CoA lyase [Rhodospirillales bacterium]